MRVKHKLTFVKGAHGLSEKKKKISLMLFPYHSTRFQFYLWFLSGTPLFSHKTINNLIAQV